LWVATDAGLYRGSTGSSGALQLELITPQKPTISQRAAFTDRRGRLWFGMENEIIQVARGVVGQGATLSYHVVKFSYDAGREDGAGKLHGYVAYWGYWVESGVIRDEVASGLRSAIPGTIPQVNDLVGRAVQRVWLSVFTLWRRLNLVSPYPEIIMPPT